VTRRHYFLMALLILVLCLGGALLRVVAESRPRPEVYRSPRDAQSTTGPKPPVGVDAQGSLLASTSAVVISDVPAYNWHHGCGPTAAGMIFGYYDGRGYDDLVPGSASTQTGAVNAMMAT
jgi:hypothetical protein